MSRILGKFFIYKSIKIVQNLLNQDSTFNNTQNGLGPMSKYFVH